MQCANRGISDTWPFSFSVDKENAYADFVFFVNNSLSLLSYCDR